MTTELSPKTLSDFCSTAAATFDDRFAMWAEIINAFGIETFAEAGVWEGDFAAYMLTNCPGLKRYCMIDPWQHLDEWNKPLNVTNERFEVARAKALARTEFAAGRREVLRMTSSDAARRLGDGALDAIYIDGNHTLRGISIDLISLSPKVRSGGIIGGDDFSPTIWQHDRRYEPTLVYPFAVHYAEGTNCPIHAPGHNQFLIHKTDLGSGFAFQDWVGAYSDRSLRRQLNETG